MRFFSLIVGVFSSVLCLAGPKNLSFSVDDIGVEGIGDSLLVSVRWTFSDEGVDDSKALVLGMSLKHGANESALRPVAVYGRKLWKDAPTLCVSGSSDELPVSVVQRRTSVVCESVLPYEAWMDTVKVLLSVSEWSRKGGLVLRSTGQKGCYAKPGKPAFVPFEWNVLEPSQDHAEYIPIEFSVPVSFDGNSQKFDPAFGDNRSVISYLVPKLRSITSTRRFALKQARLLLLDPPGPSSKESERLARARVQSVYSQLQRNGAFISYPAERVVGGIDWDGVLEWVSNSRYSSDERLREIILDEGIDSDTRVARLKGEKPAAWEDMERDCFPALGRITFSAVYKPMVFDSPKAASAVLDEIPQMLRARDFWYISSLYPKGSLQWLEVIVQGASLHPDCAALCCDAVYGLATGGAPIQASEYLRGVGSSPEGQYAYALWYYAMGRYEECVDLLYELSDESDFYRSVFEKSAPFIDWSLNYVKWLKVNL